MPGFNRDTVEIQINNDRLAVRVENDIEKEGKKKNYLHRERAYSAFARSRTFPQEVDPAHAGEIMKNGVLELNVFKKEPAPETKTRRIELK